MWVPKHAKAHQSTRPRADNGAGNQSGAAVRVNQSIFPMYFPPPETIHSYLLPSIWSGFRNHCSSAWLSEPTMGSTLPVRSAALARDTNETKIQLAINLDGGEFPADTDARLLKVLKATTGHASQSSKSQIISVNTGIGFLDHMLHALAKHAGWSFAILCDGDLDSMSSRPSFIPQLIESWSSS